MNEDCRAFCPLAHECYQRHEALTTAQETIDRSQEAAEKRLTQLQGHLEQHDTEVAFEQLALQLISEGVQLGDGADRDTTVNESLDNMTTHEGMREDLFWEIAGVAIEKARYDQQCAEATAALERTRNIGIIAHIDAVSHGRCHDQSAVHGLQDGS